MPDVGPTHQRSTVDAVRELATIPRAALDRALASLAASRAGVLAREALRVVRALDVAPDDRPAALEAITTVQRTLLHEVATGDRDLDARSWTPTVRAESAQAVRRAAAAGTVTLTPYRHRLAAQRATLLAARENASPDHEYAYEPTRHPATVPLVCASMATTAPASNGSSSPVQSPRVDAAHPRGHRVTGTARHVRPTGGLVGTRRPTTRRSLRWGAAALLSSVTIVVGAAVAPAEERPLDSPTSELSFVDRLTLPILSVWEDIVSSGRSGTDVAPTDDPTEPTPTETPAPVHEESAPTRTPGAGAPGVPQAPSVAPAPSTGAGSTDGGRGGESHRGHGDRRGQDRDDDAGRGEHGRDKDDDEDDEDDRGGRGDDDHRGDGRDRWHGRGEGNRDKNRGRTTGDRSRPRSETGRRSGRRSVDGRRHPEAAHTRP
jgi:hypothetical protein